MLRYRGMLIPLLMMPAFAVSCGSPGSRSQAAPPPTIGSLVAQGGGDGAASVISAPLAVNDVFMPCRDAAAFAGEELYIDLHPPQSWGLPACAIESHRTSWSDPPGLPDPNKEFYADVLYFPSGESPYRDNIEGLIRAGGVLIEMSVGTPERPLPPASAERNGLGQHVGAHTDVNGVPAWVYSDTPGGGVVQWWPRDRKGRRISVSVAGNYSPDEMVAAARSLVEELPSQEFQVRAPPPPPSTTTSAPCGASAAAACHAQPAPVVAPPPTTVASTVPSTAPSTTTTSVTPQTVQATTVTATAHAGTVPSGVYGDG